MVIYPVSLYIQGKCMFAFCLPPELIFSTLASDQNHLRKFESILMSRSFFRMSYVDYLWGGKPRQRCICTAPRNYSPQGRDSPFHSHISVFPNFTQGTALSSRFPLSVRPLWQKEVRVDRCSFRLSADCLTTGPICPEIFKWRIPQVGAFPKCYINWQMF